MSYLFYSSVFSPSEDDSDSQRPISEGTYHHPDDEQPRLKPLEDDQCGATTSPSPEASELVPIPVDEDRTVSDNDSQRPSEGSSSYHHLVESDDEQPRLKPLEDEEYGVTISPSPATDSTSTASQLVLPDRDRTLTELFNQTSTVIGLELPLPYDNLNPEQYNDDSEEDRNRRLTIKQYYLHF